ncbi:MAG: WhiB family transcriptional regulator [Candidatus Nanopelagicales bacterium]
MLSDQIKFPVLEQTWMRNSACNTADPELFHSPEKESPAARKLRERQAKVICNTCPVINECREWAQDTDDGFGIYAAQTADERGYDHHTGRFRKAA